MKNRTIAGIVLAFPIVAGSLSPSLSQTTASAAPKPAVQKPAPAPRTAETASTPTVINGNRLAKFLDRAKDKNIQLVFLGDSITDFWPNKGKASWEKYFSKYNPADFGVSGEHTEHTLGHIAGGILDGLHPKVVVIMIGTNNIGHAKDEQPEWAAAGIKKIVETVHAKLPETKVLLLGVFPRESKVSPHRQSVAAINAIISKYDDGNNTRYLDLTPKFLDASGEIPKDIMPDGLHPNAAGYEIWGQSMQPLLDAMMK